MNRAADPAAVAVPLACTLDADDAAARLRRWQPLSEKSPPRVQRNAHQLEIRWQLDADGARELEALAAVERECCTFVRWSVSRHEPDSILHVTADPNRPEDAATIAALFTTSRSAGC